VTVQGLVAREVDCSRLRGRAPRSSAGQWKSKFWAREGFQSLQSAVVVVDMVDVVMVIIVVVVVVVVVVAVVVFVAVVVVYCW